MEGMKHDDGKPDWYALPLELLEPLRELMLAGEQKYSAFNCLEPFKDADRRFWSANMRHAVKCQQDPLARDEETGCYHEAARAFCSLMRIYHAKKDLERENLKKEKFVDSRQFVSALKFEHGEL